MSMSSKKEERKEETTVTSRTLTPTEGHTDYQQSVNRALNETKDNVRRATDEARSQVPRYTQAVNDYQEQTIQASREIADNYLESQKEIINSLHASWVPYAENTYERFYASYISPRRMTEAYARMVSSFADNMNAATRVANNMLFANMDAFRISIQRARDNARELSRIGVNAAKTFEQTSKDTTRQGSAGGSTRVSFEREEKRERQF
jgi:vacuolar-type H+-ATPase subunit H